MINSNTISFVKPLHYPYIASISLTGKCQCNCEHCGIKKYHNLDLKQEFSLVEIKTIVDQLYSLGVSIIDLLGGEPTLRDDLCQIISYIKSKNMLVAMESNGIKLDFDYLKAIKVAGLDNLFISLDDYRSVIHDSRRNYLGAFNSARKAIQLCQEIGLTCHASFVPVSSEYFSSGEINNYLSYCMEIGVAQVRIILPVYVGNLIDGVEYINESEVDLMKYIDEKYYDYVYRDDSCSPLRSVMKSGEYVCIAKGTAYIITYNGLIFPCPYVPLVFGDMHNSSLLDIIEKIQDHPLTNSPGESCVGRRPMFIENYRNQLSTNLPFLKIDCENIINLSGTCDGLCENCRNIEKKIEQIIADIKGINPLYQSINIVGSDIFSRVDCNQILDAFPKKVALIINTDGRLLKDIWLVEGLINYAIRRINIHMFSLDMAEYNEFMKDETAYLSVITAIENCSSKCLHVRIYVEKNADENQLEYFKKLGVQSIERIETSNVKNNYCPANKTKTTSFIWLNKMERTMS